MTATTAIHPPPASSPAFRGFQAPNYTPVPDQLFDELLPTLSGAELKTLLFVIRRTFGFKKDQEAISLSQMLGGVRTRDGRTLHGGVGLCKETLLGALRSLRAKGIIRAERQRSAAKGDEATVYRLRFAGDAADPPAAHEPPPTPPEVPLVGKLDQGVVGKVDHGGWSENPTTKQTRTQQTQANKHHHPQTPSPAPAPEPEGDTLAPTSRDGEASTGAVDDALCESLISRGITRRIARQLVATHPEVAIREQVAWQPYRPAAANPAGALVEAIRDGWPPPPAWLDAQEHAVAVARQAEAEARRRAEEERARREWEAKPPEERIAGRLQFWIQKQRIKGGREPTEAEIAARRAALLAELGAPAAAGSGAVS